MNDHDKMYCHRIS